METTGNLANSIREQAPQSCSCDTSSPRCWCVDCNEALCYDCVLAHRRVTITRSHRIHNQPAGNTSTPPTKFCRLHPSEPLKLFCFTCGQQTCRDCQLTTHKDHSYLFVSDALGKLRKQLEDLIQAVRVQRDTVTCTLQDMETRLQDIVQGESHLEMELMCSYSICVDLLKKRTGEIMEMVKMLNKSESEQIQKMIEKLKTLKYRQLVLTDITEKAKNIDDVTSLLKMTTNLKLQLQYFSQQVISFPLTMSELKVVTDGKFMETLSNFGEVIVTQIPFSVSKTSTKNKPASSTITPPISNRNVPKNLTTSVTAPSIPTNPPSELLQSSSPQLGRPSLSTSNLPDSSVVLPISTCPAPTSFTQTTTQTVSHVLVKSVSCHSLSSCTNIRQPISGVATNIAASSQTVKPQSSMRSFSVFHPNTNQSQMVMMNHTKSVSSFPAGQSSSRAVFVPVQSSLRLNNPTAVEQSKPQTVRQVSCLPNGLFKVLQVPMVLNQTMSNKFSGNTMMTNTIPNQCQEVSGRPLELPPPTTENSDSARQSHMVPPINHTPTDESSALPCGPVASQSVISDVVPYSCSQQQQQRSPVVKAVADSACDQGVQQVTTTQQEAAENKPSSTIPEENEPAGKPAPPEKTEGDDKESIPVTGQQECRRVSPLRLRLSLPQSGQTLPVFSLQDAPGEAHVEDTCEQEPAENNLISTTSEETEPAEKRSPPETTDSPEEWCSPIEPQDNRQSKCQPTVSMFRLLLSLPCPGHSAKNKPTSISSPRETTDRDIEKQSSVTGQQDCHLSQYQPRVCLFRLPSSLLQPGRPLPCFHVVSKDNEDEVYVQEMVDDCQSDDDDESDDLGDFIAPLSSPESPVTLQSVSCSACGSPYSSIICEICGRGFHRNCHIPPGGPDVWSEWICSLCQDLSDPTDPYSSERRESPHLSLLDQRRCESLLLHLKVESCSQLPANDCVHSHLKLISERLTHRRSPPYETAEEFLFEIWSLFNMTSSTQDNHVLNNLQQSFQIRLKETFSSEFRHSFLTPSNAERAETSADLHQDSSNKVVTTEYKVKALRKRLKDYLDMRGIPLPKKMKKDNRDESTGR